MWRGSPILVPILEAGRIISIKVTQVLTFNFRRQKMRKISAEGAEEQRSNGFGVTKDDSRVLLSSA